MAKRPTPPIRSPEELDELRARGKQLFLGYRHKKDIAAELGVTPATVGDWDKREGWSIEREGIERGVLEDEFGARRMSLSRITKLTTELLENSLKRLADRVEPPTLSEAEKLSVIIGNLDKILRLDTNRPTDNVAIASTVTHTVEEIRARLAEDPVLGYAIQAAGAPKRIEASEAVFTPLPDLSDE
jgi:hypothetical protein